MSTVTPYPLFVDPVPGVIEKLSDELPSYHFAEDLTGWHEGDIWITVQPTGGTLTNPFRVAEPRFDVNVYGPSKPEAKEIALQAMQAMYRLKNQVLDFGVVTSVSCTWPADISDPINNNPRWVFDMTMRFRTL